MRAVRTSGNRGRAKPTAIAALLTFAFVAGCADREAPNPTDAWAGEPDERVRAEFEAVCTSLLESDHPYYGRAQVARLEAALGRLPDSPLPQAVGRAQLAMEWLRWGREADAVLRLAEAVEFADAGGLHAELRADVLRRYALAQLRLGETKHCVGGHVPASCIWPLAPEARHADRAPALGALETYGRLEASGFGTPTTRWLAAVAAAAADLPADAVPEFARLVTDAEAFDVPRDESSGGIPRYDEVAHARGLHVNEPSGGIAADDFDGDGDLDLVFSTIDPCRGLRYFENDGTGAFVERTETAGLAAQGGALNLLHADVDGDGDRDLFALRGGWFGAGGRIRNSLLLNDGGGVFRDVTRDARLAEPAYPTQTGAFGDVNGDGRLDLYVGNEADDEGRAYPSQLFLQREDGTFRDAAPAAGATNDRFAKGVALADWDDDGDLDLYVSNLGPNRYYRNAGDGTFEDVAVELGLDEPRGRSFGVVALDYDQDGRLDLFVADYGAELDTVAAERTGEPSSGGRPRLYRNLGDDRFENTAPVAGLVHPLLPMGLATGDLEDDGYPDLYLGTGTPNFESIAPNRMYANRGGAFHDVSFAGGFAHLQKGHGVAVADLDRDGTVEVVEQMGGAYPGDAYPSVYYDRPTATPGAWIELDLDGRPGTRDPFGAAIRVTVRDADDSVRTVHARFGPAGSFAGSPLDPRIGLGAATEVERLEIRWPGETSWRDHGPVSLGDRIALERRSGDVQVE